MKPKDSEYVQFTFTDLRRAEEIDILENAFAEICCFLNGSERVTQLLKLQIKILTKTLEKTEKY